MKDNECPVCSQNTNNIFYTNKNGCNYFACEACGYIFIDEHTPTTNYPKNALRRKYKFFQYFRDYRSNRNWLWAMSDALWISKYINPKNINNPQALSVGCAYAHDLFNLRKLGWGVTGIDFDNDFALRAKRQHNIDVIIDSFEEHNFKSKFDLVMFIGVVPYIDDIKETIKKTYDGLNSGGYIMINSRSIDYSQ